MAADPRRHRGSRAMAADARRLAGESATEDLRGATELAAPFGAFFSLEPRLLLAEELLARKQLARDIVGRLTDRILLIRPGRDDAVVQELQNIGHTPRVTGK